MKRHGFVDKKTYSIDKSNATQGLSVILFLGAIPLFQLLLAVLNPYGYEPIEYDIIAYVFIHVLSFYATFLTVYFIFTRFLFKKTKKQAVTINEIFALTNTTIFLVKLIFLIDIAIFGFTLYVMISKGLSFQQLRDLFFFGSIFGSNIGFGQLVISLWFLQGLRYYLLIRTLLSLSSKTSSKSSLYFWLVCISILLSDISTGGRIGTFYMASIIGIFLYFVGKDNVPRELIRKLKLVLIYMIVIVTIISINRLTEDEFNFFEFLYKYFIAPLFLFQIGISDTNGLLQNPEMRFGASVASLDWVFVGLLKKYASFQGNTLATIMDPVLATGYYLNSEGGINAFFTAFFSYFLDYGFLSSMMSGIFFGSIIAFFALKYKKYGSIRSLYFAIIYLFLYSMVTRENLLAAPWFLMLICLGLFLPKLRRR